MANPKMTTVEIEPSEVALILGEEDGSMTVRVVPSDELDDDDAEPTPPLEIAIALAMRLLNDPEFHDAVLDWYEAQDEEDGDDDTAEGGPPVKPS